MNADNLDFIDPNQLLTLSQQIRKRGAGSAPATLLRPPDEKRPRLDETPESPRSTAAKTKLSVTLKRVSPETILAEGGTWKAISEHQRQQRSRGRREAQRPRQRLHVDSTQRRSG